MFGMENKKKRALFEFDLEQELKKDSQKKETLLKHVESQIQQIKTSLRSGTQNETYDQLGVLLHGYAALQKVITRISNKPSY